MIAANLGLLWRGKVGTSVARVLRSFDKLRMSGAQHERVDAVVLRASLPKTMIGKLDRKALREEVGREEVAKG